MYIILITFVLLFFVEMLYFLFFKKPLVRKPDRASALMKLEAAFFARKTELSGGLSYIRFADRMVIQTVIPQ